MKRLFDQILSILGLLVLALPLFLLILMVRHKLGTPVFFRQMRSGLHGKPFEIIKFRTMTDERGPSGELMSDGVRLTPFGHFLRANSIDELPELWNVLKGDMSLVGPRPLLMEYLPLYTAEQARRLEVRPGITGWAQVNGRDDLSIAKKVNFDAEYLKKKSLFFDLKILYLTFIKIIKREGIQH